ncbi:hypothetical protein T190820D02B_80017 [Tenacibaculum sp. 190524A05c]
MLYNGFKARKNSVLTQIFNLILRKACTSYKMDEKQKTSLFSQRGFIKYCYKLII